MLVFVSLFFLSVMLPISKETTSFSETTIYVNPSTNYVSVGNTFVINVSVADVTDLLSFRFHLGYNTTILDGLNVWIPPPFETPIQPQIIDPDGYIHVNALSPIPLSGSSTLASITFNATAVGSSILDLYDTILLDSEGNLSHTIVDGSVTVSSAIITVPDDYPTIQEAIDAAGPGDTIQVAAGTYYERVTVNKTVTLIGEDPLTTIIDRDVYVKNVSNVVISRFTIIHLNGNGIILEYCRNSTINNNIIERAGRYAIDSLHSEGNTFTNNSILSGNACMHKRRGEIEGSAGRFALERARNNVLFACRREETYPIERAGMAHRPHI